ncbi:ATP-binding protein [Thiovibrio sp. JS02]
MKGSELVEPLKQIDLFHFFSEEELNSFARKVKKVPLASGEVLFREGEQGQEMYILLSGLLKIFRGNRVIDIIRPGNYIGEMAIIEKQPRSASVAALEDSVLLRVPYTVFAEYFAQQPKSLVAMMQTLSKRIRRDGEILAQEFEQINILVHDMKNLLTPLHLLEVLQRQEPAPGGDAYLACMIKARENLLALMERALAHVKRQQCITPIVRDSLPVLLAELQETAWPLHPDIGGRGIKVKVAGSLPDFPFSSLGLRRVLVNLVVNGAQASQPASEIIIDLGQEKGMAVIRVIDQGQGIAEALQGKVFQPHFTTKPEGSGLGLISCKQIIEESHRGSLTFQSQAGRGTTFTIRLPMERI